MSTAKLRQSQAGFGLIEAMVSFLIILIGLISILALLSKAVATTVESKDLTIANQLAREAIEGVFAARLLGAIRFDDIENVSRGGIFLDGFQPILRPGRRGIVNTQDVLDNPVPVQYTDPGKDNIYGTADDKIIDMTMFRRETRITTLEPSLKQLIVTVRFSPLGFGSPVTVTLTTLITPISS